MANVAVITGTTRGVGLTLAHVLLDAGWTVYGLNRNPNTPIHSQPNYIHCQLDVTDKAAVEKFFLEFNERINLLVNNAGVFKLAPLLHTDYDTIESIIKTNTLGPMYITKAAIGKMKIDSRIVFMNSVAGLNELDNQSVYCASKHALTAFASIVAKELRGNLIRVTSIHPGGINTPLWNDSNPYPLGDKSTALDTREIARMINYIIESPKNVDYKTIKMFPTVEWH